ncbi:MAG: hypothetical protein H0X34_14875 [Chthoniobacterales bacterium]|jgi:hypothetical protein|nr:hypothetical protein [Chthoniobacterales bacterium]
MLATLDTLIAFGVIITVVSLLITILVQKLESDLLSARNVAKSNAKWFLLMSKPQLTDDFGLSLSKATTPPGG